MIPFKNPGNETQKHNIYPESLIPLHFKEDTLSHTSKAPIIEGGIFLKLRGIGFSGYEMQD